MSVVKGNHAGSAGSDFYVYKINQSLRFNDGDTPSLTRTFGSAGDRKTWTWSGWVKRATLGEQDIFGDNTSSSSDGFIKFRSDNTLQFGSYVGSYQFDIRSSALFRDVSAWYHIVVAYDSANGTAALRQRLYVNGTEVSYGTQTNSSQNHETKINNNVSHAIGHFANSGGVQYFDGYLAEINFIDGTALTPASFGETKEGVWVPKSSSGLTFGTNGFYLPFDDSSAIGDDESSNTNDFTANNLSAYDVVPDSPTNNFSTMNPLLTDTTRTTFSEGNLKTVNSAASTSGSSIAVNSGKWFVEMVCTAKTASNAMIGICTVDGFDGERQLDESQNGGSGHGYVMNATKLPGGASYGATWAIDDIIGIALDLDSTQNTVTFYKNGSSQGAINIDNALYVFCNSNGQGSSTVTYVTNFGQDGTFAGEKTAQGNADGEGVGDFYYSVPSGYLALCTKNFPDPTIGPTADTLATDHFNTVTYTGPIAAAAAAGTTGAVTGVGFQPDWVWIKTRSTLNNHEVFDSVRGVATDGTKGLIPNTAAAEQTSNLNGGLYSLDSDGFTVVAGTDSGGRSNETGSDDRTYASWNWKAGGSASSNTNGTITSSVSANTTAGFSIGTYTGNGNGNQTVGHGLSSAPELVIIKQRSGGNDWVVFDKFRADTEDYLRLNTANDYYDYGARLLDTPTSTLLPLTYAPSGYTSDNGATYVFYAFHSVEGYSKFGKYTGNGADDGPYVFTGFRPAWVLIKRTDSSDSWMLMDNKRSDSGGGNVIDKHLRPDSSSEENDPGGSPPVELDFLSNGFRNTENNNQVNASGGTYIYLAFADQPFKFANAR